MHPVLFKVPGLGFPVRTFGALVACGILFGIWLWGRLLARYGDDPKGDPERCSQAALWVVIGVLAGARLFYVAVECTRYLAADVSTEMRSYLASEQRTLVGTKLSLEHPDELDKARKISVGYDFLHDPMRVLFLW